jgi:hypothetical protein
MARAPASATWSIGKPTSAEAFGSTLRKEHVATPNPDITMDKIRLPAVELLTIEGSNARTSLLGRIDLARILGNNKGRHRRHHRQAVTHLVA